MYIYIYIYIYTYTNNNNTKQQTYICGADAGRPQQVHEDGRHEAAAEHQRPRGLEINIYIYIYY